MWPIFNWMARLEVSWARQSNVQIKMQQLAANPLITLTICICLSLSTLIMIVMLINQAIKVKKFSNSDWLPVQSTIIHSQLNLIRDDGYPKSYTASIVFEYEVSSKKYTSNLITPDLQTSSGVNKGYGSNLTGLFPVGKKLTAYYSNSNHSVAVLFPCNTLWTWFSVAYHSIAAFGLLMLIPSIFYLYIYFSGLN